MSRPKTTVAYNPLYFFKGGYPDCFATCNKVASTTLGSTLKKDKWLEYCEPPDGKRVILVLRHPLDRLVSGFEWFVRGKYNMIPGGGNRRFGHINFAQFVGHTQHEPNSHWSAQTWQHKNWREFELIPLHELAGWWPDELPELEHKKKTKRRPWPEYYDDELRAQCEARFAEDIEAYEQAVSSGVHTR